MSFGKSFGIALPIIQQENEIEAEVKKYNQLFIDNYTNDIGAALNYIIKAKKLAMNLENDSLRNKWVGETAKNAGVAYDLSGLSDKALENYFIAIRAGEQSNNLILLQKVYNNIGALYGAKGDNEKSLLYLEKSDEL